MLSIRPPVVSVAATGTGDAKMPDDTISRGWESTAVAATTVKSAGKRLASLVHEVNTGTVAVEITGKTDSAVLVSLAHYTALQEATFLLRSPELMDSLRRELARTLVPPAPDRSADADPSSATATCRRGSKAKARKKKRAKRKKKNSA
ncbi:type II toxin-antitoxin system Phd/YefM family antitoxin [Rhodococcus gannanensis]|uniref:Type II toxin-antitoxin system Phd/YefM family antitoxin n=1 Tax=Rhodococcus gannanensis TaxID=1960308 RepID=A0ABW4P6V4_9NOCA